MEGLKPLLIQKWSEFYQLCKSNGIDIGFVSGYRGQEAQDALYAKGRTAPGQIVTQAKWGQSLHNYGVAFDCCPKVNGVFDWNQPRSVWLKMGELGRSIGLEHGDRGFEDLPHFQILMGYSLADFQNGKVDWSKYGVAKQVQTVVTPPVETTIAPNPVNVLIDDLIAYLNKKRI